MNAPVLRFILPVLLGAVAGSCAPAGPPGAVPGARSGESALADTSRIHLLSEVGTPPEFVNLADVVRMMTRNHPPLLRDTGRGGTVVMGVHLGRNGRVRSARVLRSSGDEQMDALAMRAAVRLRARPARIEDVAVAVEVEIPFEFGVGP